MENIDQLLKINKQIILASQSPRRKFLLELIGLKFDIIPSNIDEDHLPIQNPGELVKELSYLKAKAIGEKHRDAIIIAADTIVWLNDEILSKPIDAKEAKMMLQKLSNNTHKVFTGITLFNLVEAKQITDYVVTEVTFRKLDEKEIDAYIKTGSPLDKAGAYGIQDDFGAVFVSNISGCYYNIVGLPVSKLYEMLKTFIQN